VPRHAGLAAYLHGWPAGPAPRQLSARAAPPQRSGLTMYRPRNARAALAQFLATRELAKVGDRGANERGEDHVLL
jgi:hypothetical protein